MHKISIIVPLYNNEDTILSCLSSIVIQDWQRKEIIVIDDGSTDKSLLLCKEFSKDYNDLVIITQKHAGPSASRNNGIRASTGSFICFCDSDDELLPSALSSLMGQLKESTDLIVGNVSKNNSPIIIRDEWVTRKESIRRFFKHDETRLLGTVYGKLFRRTIIEPPNDVNLLFDETITIGEDALFLLHYLLRCRGIQLCKSFVYMHNQNPGGLIASSHLPDYFSALQASKRMIEAVTYDHELLSMAIEDYCWVLDYLLNRFPSINDRERILQESTSIRESLCGAYVLDRQIVSHLSKCVV